MASEIQSDRARKAQELKELQETYSKARKKAQSEGQSELEQVRTENVEAVEHEREAGEASVNHISKKANQQIQEVKARGEERITYEKEDVNRKFRTTREKGRNDLAAMQRSIDEQKEALAHTHDSIRKKVNDLDRRENDVTNDIVKKEMSRRRKVMAASSEEITSVQKKGIEDKEKVRQGQVTELRQMIEKHRTQTEFLKKQQADMIQKQKSFIGAQLKDREQSDAKRIEGQRLQFNEREKSLRESAQQQYDKESTESKTRINELKSASRESIKQERDRGHKGVEMTRQEYTKQIQSLQNDGDKEVARQVEGHREILSKEDVAFRTQIDDKQARHRTSTEELALNHRKEMERSQSEYRKQQGQQKSEYDTAFQVNDKVFKDSLQDQHDRLTVALAKDKLAVTEDVGRYGAQKEDPFYRLAETDAAISDDGHQYVLTATVPEHEKENVKVFVQGKNVVVTGHRKYDDAAQSDAGEKIKTTSYQTFRKEIPITESVMEKYVTQVWENGQLRVKLPKG